METVSKNAPHKRAFSAISRMNQSRIMIISLGIVISILLIWRIAVVAKQTTFTTQYWGFQIINGLVLGGVYALVALGYTMVYGILFMINFAHGEVMMMGGFAGFFTLQLLTSLGWTEGSLYLSA
jgi:branched-chain amino acid transport system permease protein